MNKKIKPLFISILYALMFVITQMAVSIIAIFIISLCTSQNRGDLLNISTKVLDTFSANVLLISILGNFVFLSILFIIYRRRINKNVKFNFKSLKSLYFLLSLFAIISFSISWNSAFEIIPLLRSINMAENIMQGNLLLYIISIYIIAPITEEICFREIIISKLRRYGVSDLSAIIISAGLFGLVHFMTGNPTVVLFAFIGGLIFSICYILTGSLTATIIVHIAGNLCDKMWRILELFSIQMQYIFIILLSGCAICLFVFLFKAIFSKKAYVRS